MRKPECNHYAKAVCGKKMTECANHIYEAYLNPIKIEPKYERSLYIKLFIMCMGAAPLLALVMFTVWYLSREGMKPKISPTPLNIVKLEPEVENMSNNDSDDTNVVAGTLMTEADNEQHFLERELPPIFEEIKETS